VFAKVRPTCTFSSDPFGSILADSAPLLQVLLQVGDSHGCTAFGSEARVVRVHVTASPNSSHDDGTVRNPHVTSSSPSLSQAD
jgi:hypothetical protein